MPGEAGVAAGAPHIRPALVVAVGTAYSLFAAAVSWAYTFMTGTSLWSQQPDAAADWRYIVGINLVYWNSWAVLTPAILSFAERFPFTRRAWRRSLPWHLVGGLLFVAAHVLMTATGRTWLQHAIGMSPSWWWNVSDAYLRTLDWELTYYWAAVGLGHAMLFYRAAERAADEPTRSREAARLWVRTDHGFELVSVEEIDWIEAAGNYACLHVGAQTHVIRESMKNLESRLAPEGFVRINRPTIVNIDRVKALETGASREPIVVLRDGTRLPAARRTEQKIRARLT